MRRSYFPVALGASLLFTGCNIALTEKILATQNSGTDVEQKAPQPSFDKRQSESERLTILADGREHTLMILFSDEVMARLKPEQGTIKDASGTGLVFSPAHQDAYSKFLTAVAGFQFKSFSALDGVQAMTEAELAQEEAENSTKLGIDYPNRASWVVVALAPYSAEALMSLARSLDTLPFVRMTEIQPGKDNFNGAM
jgi:hypothetical protein